MTESTIKSSNPIFSDEQTKNWLKSVLREEIALVEFVKSDGSVRKMKCTLSNSEIPTEKLPKNTKTTKNDTALAVFDLEKQEWRSFKWDSIKSIEFDS